MADPPIHEPELLRRVSDARLAEVHTSEVGIVEKYDSTNHTVDVRIAAKPPVKAWDDSVVYEDPPVLPAVPVCCFGTEREYNKVTLQAGDSVWLVYAETSPAEFLETGSVSEPGDTARHSRSGAMAIPFVRPGKLPASPKVQLGGDVLAQFVALATLVDANFSAIKAAWVAWGAAGAPAGAILPQEIALANVMGALPLPSTACTTTKAK